MRRAWPELATPEQNAVPWRFLEMYYPLRYENLIREASDKKRLDPYLVMALIRQESAFNPNAKSWVGATGLMQIMPATGQELGDRVYGKFSTSRLADPEVNVELGTRYLRQVIDLFDGNVELALAGYNGGPYRIRRWRQQNPSQPLDEFIEGMPLSETRGYVKRITLLRTSYQELYGSRANSPGVPSPASWSTGSPDSRSIRPNRPAISSNEMDRSIQPIGDSFPHRLGISLDSLSNQRLRPNGGEAGALLGLLSARCDVATISGTF